MILNIESVSKTYDEKTILNDFSLTMDERERIAILGASGQGKTTLLRLILGLTAADGGTVSTADKLHILVVFQEDRLLMQFNALENLNVYPQPFNKEEACELLSRLGLGEAALSKKAASEYSGGMRRRLAMARALYGCLSTRHSFPDEPLLLVMDEPFKGLDVLLKEKVIETVDEVLKATGCALLMVTHDEKEAAALGCSLISI